MSTPEREIRTIDEWEYNGRRCKLKDNGLGAYCGYVQTDLPESVGYDDLREIDAPAELTYGVDEDGWLGFDCGHGWDHCVDENGDPLASPVPQWSNPEEEYVTVWTPEKVRDAIEELAEAVDASGVEELR